MGGGISAPSALVVAPHPLQPKENSVGDVYQLFYPRSPGTGCRQRCALAILHQQLTAAKVCWRPPPQKYSVHHAGLKSKCGNSENTHRGVIMNLTGKWHGLIPRYRKLGGERGCGKCKFSRKRAVKLLVS